LGSGGIAARILNLCTGWRCVVSFTGPADLSLGKWHRCAVRNE